MYCLLCAWLMVFTSTVFILLFVNSTHHFVHYSHFYKLFNFTKQLFQSCNNKNVLFVFVRFQNNFISFMCILVFRYGTNFLLLCEMCKQIFFSFFYVVAYWRLLLCKLTIPVDVNDISFDSQHFKLFDFIICAVTYWFRVCTKKLLYFLANKCNTFIFSVLLKINCIVAISFHRFCPDRKWSAFRNNSLKCICKFSLSF